MLFQDNPHCSGHFHTSWYYHQLLCLYSTSIPINLIFILYTPSEEYQLILPHQHNHQQKRLQFPRDLKHKFIYLRSQTNLLTDVRCHMLGKMILDPMSFIFTIKNSKIATRDLYWEIEVCLIILCMK